MDYNNLGRPQFGSSIFKFFVMAMSIGIFCAIFIGLFWNTANNLTGRAHDLAQAEAYKFLHNAGIDAQVQCAGIDSDGDGYISCPYFTRDGTLHPLECAGAMTMNSSCRPPKAVFTTPIGR